MSPGNTYPFKPRRCVVCDRRLFGFAHKYCPMHRRAAYIRASNEHNYRKRYYRKDYRPRGGKA